MPSRRAQPLALGLAAGVLLAAAGLLVWSQLSNHEVVLAFGDQEIIIPKLLGGRRPQAMRVIYLHRGGATLTAGTDDSHASRSSVVAARKRASAVIPAFRGSGRAWRQIVSCLREQYAPFEVEVTDQRPARPGYIMAVFGGTPAAVGASGRVAGLAPFSGEPVADAVVLVFTRTLGERPRVVCETAAMEIAHAYGLDHQYTCKDPMGYLRGCGAKKFRAEAMRCGERAPRDCADGSPTQSSVGKLLGVLGPRRAPAR